MEQPQTTSTTMERIAEIAGVSRSTVSRVLNDDANVKQSTRETVLAVVEQERFVLNRSARGLALGRTGMVGIVLSVDFKNFFSDPFFGSLLQATYAAARRHELVLSLWMPEDADDRKTVDQLAHGGVLDGVVMAAEAGHDPLVDELSRSNKPFVLLGRSHARSDLSFVDVDNRQAARVATAHLLQLGRKRVGTIAGPTFSIAGADRLAGYHDAHRDAGIAVDRSLIYEGDFGAEAAAKGARQLTAAGVDAIFAANDVMALAAIDELAKLSIDVPGSVAVVGFDDVPAAAAAPTPLTTIRQSIPDLADEAMGLLTDLIADSAAEAQHRIVPTELVVRASCGAPVHDAGVSADHLD